MSTRPTIAIPTWSTSGSNIEPSAGKKAAGWQVNERPPAEWLNWLENSAGQWLQFLADVTAASPTTDLQLNFANPSALTPALDVTVAPAASSYKLLLRTLITPSVHADIWLGTTSRKFVVSHNAQWNGSAWCCEDTAQVATAIALVQDGAQSAFEALFHAATASTWADSAWSRGNILAQSVSAASMTLATLTVTGTATIATANVTTLTSSTIHASGAVTMDANVTVGGDLTVDEEIHASGGSGIKITSALEVDTLTVKSPHFYLDSDVDIVHQGPATAQPTRYVCLDISRGTQWAGSYGEYEHANGRWVTNTSGGTATIEFPIEVHRATLRVSVHVVWEADGPGELNEISLIRWNRDFTTGVSLTPPGAWDIIGTPLVQASAPAASAVCETKYWDYAFDPTTERYAFVIEMQDGVRNRLYAVRYGFSDPGPRNG